MLDLFAWILGYLKRSRTTSSPSPNPSTTDAQTQPTTTPLSSGVLGGRMQGGDPNKITIHCSATPNGKEVPAKTIKEWHLARGFKDIGYHLIIQPDGTCEHGRPLNQVGAHVEGANRDNIGICLIGTDKFTKAQFSKLYDQLEGIRLTYMIHPIHLHCHYEFPSAAKQGKTCPNIPIQVLLWWWTHNDWRVLLPYILK